LSAGPLLYSLIALMIAGWSGNYVAGKIALREFPPLLLAGWRAQLAGVMILPAYFWERRRNGAGWTRSEAGALLALGLLGVSGNQLLFVLGLSRTSVAHAAIFANMIPIVILILSTMKGLEKITAPKLAGMTIALGGVALLKTLERRAPGGPAASWLGDLLIFSGSFAFALFTVFGKPYTKSHSAVTVMAIAYVTGAIAMAPITVWESAHFPLERISCGAWAAAAYMALFSSVISYLIYYWALGRMAPSRISAFSYLQPPAATLLGVIVLGEHVTLPLVVSAGVILAGVAITERCR
jgi:drug/metabolite transporter (DMT)-like permease